MKNNSTIGFHVKQMEISDSKSQCALIELGLLVNGTNTTTYTIHKIILLQKQFKGINLISFILTCTTSRRHLNIIWNQLMIQTIVS